VLFHYIKKEGQSMMVNKIVICPICGKKTWLRIQDGGYLNEYPIRVNCINCRTLLKGVYIMTPQSPQRGLFMVNADIEECDLNTETLDVKNADYVAEISGELPCENVMSYKGNIPTSPFLKSTEYLEDIQGRIERLTYFAENMADWKRKKSTAFQLLSEGSIDFIAKALRNRMGKYRYECDNYLKSLQCLQEIVEEETKYLFLQPGQDDCIADLIDLLSSIDKEKMHELIEQMDGIEGLIRAYRKAIEVFSSFMTIYPNLLPAETYMRYAKPLFVNVGIATCSFGDVKSFYQDAYEALLSLLYIPVCLDNIIIRGEYSKFVAAFNGEFRKRKYEEMEDDYHKYLICDNGYKIGKIVLSEPLQKAVAFPANKSIRNGIGHNNIKYDGITQIITAYDLKDPNRVTAEKKLMEIAVDCLGLAKSVVIMTEIIMFILRQEFRNKNVRSIIHPRFYKNAEPNGKCPCGSNLKYKKCCRNDIELVMRPGNDH
jgi:tetratricopeptide (TPR) repeat protein